MIDQQKKLPRARQLGNERFEAVRVEGAPASYAVKTKIGRTWYTVAETYCVPGLGSSSSVAALVADAMNKALAPSAVR